jgi:hypothetical protein
LPQLSNKDLAFSQNGSSLFSLPQASSYFIKNSNGEVSARFLYQFSVGFRIYGRHSRECGNPVIRCKTDWIPAFAGMTNKDKTYRQTVLFQQDEVRATIFGLEVSGNRLVQVIHIARTAICPVEESANLD